MKKLPRGRRREGIRERVRRLEREAAAARESARDLGSYRDSFRAQTAELFESRKQLESTRDRYVELFDFAPIGYVIVDEHGLIVEVNLTGCSILGIERSRLLGMPFRGRVIPEHRRIFLDHLRRSWTANTTVALPIELGTVNGKILELHSRRTPSGPSQGDNARRILTAFVDVSDRVGVKQSLAASETRSSLAVSAAGAGTWEWDPSTKVLVWSSDHFLLLGLSDAVEPSFAEWQRCADPVDRPQLEILGRHETASLEIDLEYKVLLPDGGLRWLRTMGRAVRSPQEAPKVVGITLDITSLKTIEGRLLRLNAALEDRTAEAEASASRLRAVIAELARAETREQARLAEILHDHVQQVLVAADMKLAQVMRKSKDADEGAALAQVSAFVREALHRTSLLSRDYNPRILEDAGLLQALEWQASAIKEEFGLLVRVERLTESEPVEHEVRVILFRAVKELLFNVVKHAKTARARVRVARNGEMLEIEVSDGGVGFDVRKDTKGPATEATRGQGLPRIRDRILALGGQFRVESVQGVGTRAKLLVPLQPSGRSPIAEPADKNPRGRPKDDEWKTLSKDGRKRGSPSPKPVSSSRPSRGPQSPQSRRSRGSGAGANRENLED